MAQITFHADLLSAAFPFNFRDLGSSIVMPQQGEGPMQTPANLHGTGAEQQAGYCQAYYLENALPTARGYASVAYTKLASGPVLEPMEHMLEVRASDNSLVQVGVLGANVYIALPTGVWKASTVLRDPSYAPQVAVVRGVSYLWFGTYVVYKYDSSVQDLVLMNIPALSSATIKGICSGGAQLVIHDDETIYYSSVLDTADFTPSLATGAGSTKVLDIRGSIMCCVSLSSDFVIYTQYNAVHARTTGNLQFPFNFKEIAGSIGAAKLEHIAGNGNTGLHVIYTTAGFQQISNKGAEFIWPELSDGITLGVLPVIEPLSDIPELINYDSLAVKMSFIADRWICVSLGTDPTKIMYTDCHVFDTNLARWGRLKVSHTCIFQWNIELQEYTGDITSYQDLQDTYPTYDMMEGLTPVPLTYLDISTLTVSNAALTKNRAAICSSLGNITAFAINGTDIAGDPSANGGTDATLPRVFLGKYKISRNHGLIHQWIRCNQLKVGKVVLHGHDYNGAFVRRRDTLKESPRHKDTWYENLNADSVSIEFQGIFSITDLTVCCTDAGTMNSYAAATKKFDRLLLSNIYPAEVYDFDTFTTAYELKSASQFNTVFFETPFSSDGVQLISGAQDVVIRYIGYTAIDLDTFHSSYSLVGGEQLVVIRYINYTATDLDTFQSSYSLVSGSQDVVIRYINYTATEEQTFAATTCNLISGALT